MRKGESEVEKVVKYTKMKIKKKRYDTNCYAFVWYKFIVSSLRRKLELQNNNRKLGNLMSRICYIIISRSHNTNDASKDCYTLKRHNA